MLRKTSVEIRAKRAEEAKVEAKDIIEQLNPANLIGWANLIFILESCLKRAKRGAEIQQEIENLP